MLLLFSKDVFITLFRYFVLAKTDPNERPGKAFTGFIVDADSPGVVRGRKVRLFHVHCVQPKASSTPTCGPVTSSSVLCFLDRKRPL